MTAPAIELPAPQPGGYTADDLDRIPGLPPHTELIDGGFFFVTPQKNFHSLMVDLLVGRLRRSCPTHLTVRREMSIVLGKRQRPEPDVVVILADAVTSLDQTWFPAAAVVLAVEVVSPDSEERDRDRKPRLYAQAGIKHFWLIEEENSKPLLSVYRLDPVSKTYVATGVFKDKAKLTVPYEIEIDLTEIYRL